MTYQPVSILLLLLNYLVASEGALSAPLHLSVDLLDFQAFAHWCPGAGNPPGSRYSLEFIDIKNYSKPVWNPVDNCTNITSTHCHVTLHHLWIHYFLRVRAEWEHKRSDWTSLPISFQPYKDSRLSPPHLVVSTSRSSTCIQLSHPVQSHKDVFLQFSVDLFLVTSDNTAQQVAQDTSTGTSSFSNLPPGHYCINTSAFYMQWSRHSNYNTSQCFSLAEAHTERVVYIIGGGVALLVIISIGITLSGTCYYVKAQSMKSSLPTTLFVKKGPGMVLTHHHEELHTLSPVNTANVLICEEDDSHLTDPCSDVEKKLSRNSHLYSTVRKLEESEEGLLQRDTNGCLPEEPGHFSGVLTSGTLTNTSDEDSKVKKTLNTVTEGSTEESRGTDYQAEETETSEAVSDSLDPKFILGSNYEPRLDPLSIIWISK